MRENEAQTKWCPFVRAARDDADFSANRDRSGQIIPRKHTCIGSDCMAWRWGEQEAGWGHYADGTPHEGGHGYCGIAGRPE